MKVKEYITTKTFGDVTIMLYYFDDCWEVYYRKPQYAFEFAFGIPHVHTAEEVFEIAEGNIRNYDFLFE